MPAITASPGIRCPQTSTVTPTERRLLSEPGSGYMDGRTIEQDERPFQTLTWAVNTAQAAEWKRWWRDDLVFGGAWFSAPATWPTPEGLVVKVRRFAGPPSWQYLGAGNWIITAACEVRGATALPITPGNDLDAFFEDTFTGAEIGLFSHIPDEQINNSAWNINGLDSQPYLLGDGRVGTRESVVGLTGADIYFAWASYPSGSPGYLPVVPGWEFLVDFTPKALVQGDFFNRSKCRIDLSATGTGLEMTVSPSGGNVAGPPMLRISTGSGTPVVVDYVLPSGPVRLRLFMELDGYTATINEEEQPKVTLPSGPQYPQKVRFRIGQDWDASGDFLPGGSMTIERIRLAGTLEE